MGEAIFGIIWLIIFSVSGIVMIIYLRKFTNDERMAMIEKGMSPAELHVKRNSATLKFALLLIGGGLGLLFGYFLDEAFYMGDVAYFSMLFIFGGGGLGMAYIIEEKKAN